METNTWTTIEKTDCSAFTAEEYTAVLKEHVENGGHDDEVSSNPARTQIYIQHSS